MKSRIIVCLVTGLLFSMISAYRAFASEAITFDETPKTDNGEQIGEEYSESGIHFFNDTISLTDPELEFYRSTIVPSGETNDIFWYPDAEQYAEIKPTDYPLDVYPYPTSQYLAVDKPEGDLPLTGVAIAFNYFCTEIEFGYRKPGTKDNKGKITISLFNTPESPTAFYDEQITSYTIIPVEDGANADGWQEYSLVAPSRFNLVVLTSDKKFGIEDLTITEDPDSEGIVISYPDDSEDNVSDMPTTKNDSDDSDAACFVSNIM